MPLPQVVLQAAQGKEQPYLIGVCEATDFHIEQKIKLWCSISGERLEDWTFKTSELNIKNWCDVPEVYHFDE